MTTEPVIEQWTSDGWARLFAECERSAIHLETRDVYTVAGEAEEFAAWKAGHRDDLADRDSWWNPWLDIIAQATARGVLVKRARIVSEPVNEYIRFEYDGTFANIAAGEQVRWLPRRHASALVLPGNDFWAFDDRLVVFNHFTGNGEPVGKQRCDDRLVIQTCTSAFDTVWDLAIAHKNYRPT